MQTTTFSAAPRKLDITTFGRVQCLSEGGAPAIGGHGAVYYNGSPGTEYTQWGVTLRLRTGCLDHAIATSDTHSYFNHDENYLLGRKGNGTVSLKADDVGVFYVTTINEKDPMAISAYAKVERGDCKGSSMMFRILDSEIEQINGQMVEWITKIDPLYEIGPVVNPAMTDANSIAMNEAAAERYIEELKAAMRGNSGRSALRRREIDLISLKS